MSTEPLLPPDVREFLTHIVRSTWNLEVLMLLHNERGRAWRRAEINREIRGTLSIVENALAGFIKARLVAEVEPGLFRYEPADQLDDLVDRLAKANAAYPFAVMKALILAPNEKLHTFVDAFRLKKE